MLGEYSNFPFRGSGEGIGAMVRDEVESNRDKELQLEIVAAVLQGTASRSWCDILTFSVHPIRLDFVSLRG